MSILIIALPRTGSTVMCRALAKALGYKFVMEPFNTKTPRSKLDLSDITHDSKVVVKTMIEQFPKSPEYMEKHPELFKNDPSIEFNLFFAKRFNHVILLDRQDVYDQCISLTNAQARTKVHLTQFWHVPYRAEIDDKAIEDCQFKLRKYKSNLEYLSKFTDYEITHYERVYSEKRGIRRKIVEFLLDSNPDFDIKAYVDYTDPKHRYRKQDKPKGLL